VILVTWDVHGTEITALMSEEEFKDEVLNAHRNLTRPRYPYVWKRSENATEAEIKKVKKIKINDPNDSILKNAKEAKIAKKFKKVILKAEKEKADQLKRIADGIKAKKAEA
jgi:hypothetical protein